MVICKEKAIKKKKAKGKSLKKETRFVSVGTG